MFTLAHDGMTQAARKERMLEVTNGVTNQWTSTGGGGGAKSDVRDCFAGEAEKDGHGYSPRWCCVR